MENIKPGTILIAKDPCKMNSDGRETLTVGKEYPVVHVSRYGILIIDDDGDTHGFAFSKKERDSYKMFFDIKK